MYILISIHKHTITPYYIILLYYVNTRIFMVFREKCFTLFPIFTPSEIGLKSTLRSGFYYYTSVPELYRWVYFSVINL